MTARSLFNIILKVFGLLFLKEFVIEMPLLLSNLVYYFTNENLATMWTVVTYATAMLLYIGIAMLLFFKTNKIIDRLKLDEGFNQHDFSFEQTSGFTIGISSSLVMNIFLLVLGGYILIDEIPNFFRAVYLYWQQKNLSNELNKVDLTGMVVTSVKVLIGFLIIGERNMIADLIKKKEVKEKDGE